MSETALQTKKQTPIEEFRGGLTRLLPEIQKALPPQVSVEKFERVVMTAIQGNPSLLNYDRKSLFGACVKAATDGLLPDGREGALVPYKGQIQWLPMIYGVLKKVRNSGELSSITSQVVYANDEFDYWLDEKGEHLKHKPTMDDPGPKRLVYAIATTKDGAIYIERMTQKQVMDVRSCSKAKDGPWNGPFEDEMWRKTAIRRLAKRLPMSTDLERVITRDDALYDFSKEKPASRLNSTFLGKPEEKSIDNEESASDEIAIEGEVVETQTPVEGDFTEFEQEHVK